MNESAGGQILAWINVATCENFFGFFVSIVSAILARINEIVFIQDFVYSGIFSFGILFIRDFLHSGICPFRILFIRDFVHLRLLGNLLIWDFIHLKTLFIRDFLHSELCSFEVLSK